MQAKRQSFYKPEGISREAEIKLKQIQTENKSGLFLLSLLVMDEAKEYLMGVGWVSVSIDAANEDIWRKIDRPRY